MLCGAQSPIEIGLEPSKSSPGIGGATALKSSYCSLAHGQVLADKFYTSEEVAALVSEPANDPVDRAG